ncbi:PepSY-associated TM helix domain-containing protein [Qipengyuania sp. MTN3-11]|uniref:PepSY-associated TM helix domain-containing protein n=1 Tax=Qipengyuania sp. MTN3-11 TaxID=3056557 RepID=UPI0036F3F5DA
MSRRTIRIWYLIHRWSSLVSTLFLLMLCVTGLPLIFHDEIDATFGTDWESRLAGNPSATTGQPLDSIVAAARDERPGEVPLFIGFSQDSSLITVTTGPTPDAPGEDMTLLYFDRLTGQSLGPVEEGGVMDVILGLHTDMLLGFPGMIFLGVMGILFIVALVSGVVLYAPFMRRLRFGTLRQGRSRRVRTLDRHNLIGVATLGWALVVGGTGAINAFADPLVDGWREGELAAMIAQQSSTDPLAPEDYGSLDRAMARAQAALPGRSPQFVGFPGGAWSGPRHYAIFFQGDRPLTSHLLTPALLEADSGRLVDAREMPGLNKALMLSKPLHFGDYGGLAFKLLWAALDLLTIWVLWTGLVLWMRRSPGRIERRIDEIATGGARGATA